MEIWLKNTEDYLRNPFTIMEVIMFAPLIQKLTDEIFSPETRRLAAKIRVIVQENRRLGGHSEGFYFSGQVFSDIEPKLRVKGALGNPHPEIIDMARQYIIDYKEVSFDRERVKQALTLLLIPCRRSHQDIFDALPNLLHDALKSIDPSFQGLSRKRPEAWSIEGNPRALSQYNKLREKVEFYNISKLIY